MADNHPRLLRHLAGLILRHGLGTSDQEDSSVQIMSGGKLVICFPENLLKNAGVLGACFSHEMIESHSKIIHIDSTYSTEAIKMAFTSASIGEPMFEFSQATMDDVVEAVFLMEEYCFDHIYIDAAVESIKSSTMDVSQDCAFAALSRLHCIIAGKPEIDKGLEMLVLICATKIARDTPDFRVIDGLQNLHFRAIESILQHVDSRVLISKEFVPQSPAIYSDVKQEVQIYSDGEWDMTVHFTDEFTHVTAKRSSFFGMWNITCVGDPTLVGKRVKVLWSRNKWYTGVVIDMSPCRTHHTVLYDDGDKRTYDMAIKTFQVWDGHDWRDDTSLAKIEQTQYSKSLTVKYDSVHPNSKLSCTVVAHKLEMQFRAVVAWLTSNCEKCFADPVQALLLYKEKMALFSDDEDSGEEKWRESASWSILIEYVSFAMAHVPCSFRRLSVRDIEDLLKHPNHHSPRQTDLGYPSLTPPDKTLNEIYVLRAVLEWAFLPEKADEDADEDTMTYRAAQPPPRDLERLVTTYITPHIPTRISSEQSFKFFRWLPITIRRQWSTCPFLEQIARMLDNSLCSDHRVALLTSFIPAA